jgi:dUTP pyrophosphatase
MLIKFRRLTRNAICPIYASEGAAGADLHAVEDTTIGQDGRVSIVRTGLALEIPFGYEGQIRLRSSMGMRGICIPHGVGTIDSDYRGEILVPLVCLGSQSYVVESGERFAQLVIVPVARVYFKEAGLSETVRGVGGFGSTSNARMRREDWLRASGFKDPTDEERREQLARNVALKDWGLT